MMNELRWPALACFAVLALGACGTQTRVVLLPDAAGTVGQVVVDDAHGTRSLDRAYQASTSGRFGASVETLNPDAVRTRYGGLLDALPKAPRRTVLYFDAGSALSDASRAEITQLQGELASYGGAELIVTGHTDRVGSVEANDALSERRAELVRDLLISQGFARATIHTVGRGEREPLVPTDDEVAEPRNRRVEIKVR